MPQLPRIRAFGFARIAEYASVRLLIRPLFRCIESKQSFSVSMGTRDGMAAFARQSLGRAPRHNDGSGEGGCVAGNPDFMRPKSSVFPAPSTISRRRKRLSGHCPGAPRAPAGVGRGRCDAARPGKPQQPWARPGVPNSLAALAILTTPNGPLATDGHR